MSLVSTRSTVVALLLVFAATAAATKGRLYTNSWAVEVKGGTEKAEELAHRHGFVNLGQVGNLANIYHFTLVESTQHDLSKRAIYSLSVVGEKSEKTAALLEEENVGIVEQQELISREKLGYTAPIDPGWSKQWTLENTGQTSGLSGLDLNVEPVWMQGITGIGVVVAFVDDGLEHTHLDLSANYDSVASFDFVHRDSDPTPDYNVDEPNHHGTSCAGEVGMAKGNDHCGVGVAYECNIGSLKHDVSQLTDIIDADTQGFKNSYVDVYSNSWGPIDSGFHIGGPGTLLQQTLETATTEGRGGKGNIYVWSSGNGGYKFDSCAADGYVNSIYTIAIGSANQNAEQASYGEQCAGKMAVTFSHNSDTFPSPGDDWVAYNQVYTTTLNGQCTSDFTGTSAAAPLASGVIALALQANPDLTWRDVQYLIAYTSNSDILHNGEWTTNGAGLPVSHKFGFGAIDAEAMVTRARRWTNVPEQLTFLELFTDPLRTLSSNSQYSGTFDIPAGCHVHFLEHVVVHMSLSLHGYAQGYSYGDYPTGSDESYIQNWLKDQHTKRGDIMIELTSPQGTKSVLLPYREYDFVNEEGYDNWPFMTVHHWGESPIGTWTLTLSFKSLTGYIGMDYVNVMLYGTASTPVSVSSIPSTCNAACARGCSGPGPGDCDICRNFRVAETLECVDTCPSNTIQYDKYCLADPTTTPPTTSPPATSPPATSPPATSPPATSPPATSLPATSPQGTSPQDTSPPATSSTAVNLTTTGNNGSKTTIIFSTSISVAFIAALVVTFITIACIYYWKCKARSTNGFQFIPLKQEPQNV